MGFEIVEMKELSGDKAHIYSVILNGDGDTLLEQFFNENSSHEKLLKKMLIKIKTMADKTGCLRQFFKDGEGRLGDGVVALAVQNLRLYGIYFNSTVVLLGSGGIKNVRAYQDDPVLNKKAEQVKSIASEINRAIINKEFKVSDNGELEADKLEDYD